MKIQEKIALVRVITDLIKADNIIDVSEMTYLLEIQQKYDIKQEHLISAQKINFGQAVNTLKELSKHDFHELMEDMSKLAFADGNCSPEEAFLIMTLRYCLMPEYSNYCKLITTNVTNITIERKNIVYTETEYDEEANKQIQKILRYIKDDFHIVGLNFVYIPEVCMDFKNMDEQYLHDIINFLAPTLAKESQDNIYTTLRNISTKDFCYEFLIKKMELDPIFDSDPSLLFQVCTSLDKVVYMHLALNEDVIHDMEIFVDEYKKLTQSNISVIPDHRHNNERFFYYGFRKALFDLIAFPGKMIESRILIDLYKRRVSFIDLGENLNLSVKQLALYILIIQQSVCTNPHELLIDSSSEKRKEVIRETFNHIYGAMSCSDSSEYTTGITPTLSKIKKAISSIRFLDNISAYIPERVNGIVRVKIKPEKILVKKGDGRILHITADEEWMNM